MREQFRVEKVELAVSVTMKDGSALEGRVFLAGVSPLHGGEQTLVELLDEEAAFLPMLDDEGEFVVVGKEAIALISYDSGSDGQEFVRRMPARIFIVGGAVVEGDLIVPEGPAAFRAIDYLNSCKGWFTVDSPGTVTLINAAAAREIKF